MADKQVKVEKSRDIQALRDRLPTEKELTKDDIIGLLVIDLNTAIYERLKDEYFKRRLDKDFALLGNKVSKEKSDSITSAMEAVGRSIRDDDESIKTYRQLIEEVKDDRFVI